MCETVDKQFEIGAQWVDKSTMLPYYIQGSFPCFALENSVVSRVFVLRDSDSIPRNATEEELINGYTYTPPMKKVYK